MQDNLYKLVIIDDEEIIRKGLSEFINWEELGFYSVGAFEDGKEALEYIKKNDVNVVLTDIKMAEISGLEVAKYIHNNKPAIKVVIISGYKEFEYAQKAIEYNVEHYLLKPTDFRNVYKVFRSIKTKLDEQIEKNKQKSENQQKLKEMLPMLQRQFFVDIILGALRDKNNIKKRFELIGLKCDLNSPCALIEFKINKLNDYLNSKWNHGKTRLMIALSNFIREKYSNISLIPVYFFEDSILIIGVSINYLELEHFKLYVNKNITTLINSINDILNLKIQLSNIKYFNCVYNIYDCKQARKFIPTNTNDQKVKLDKDTYEFFTQKYKLLLSNINEGNVNEVGNIVDSLIDEIKFLPIEVVQKNVIDLFVLISRKYLRLNINVIEINNCFDYKKVLMMDDVEKIRGYCKDNFKLLIHIINQYKDVSSTKIIKKAIDFMNKYYNKDISLENVANHVYFNAVYFSRFFKQQTGENFIDYLTKIRMEQAIKLLRTQKYKIYEISSKTGYKSSKYFTRVFKQYTGYTPKEYIINVVN